MFLKSSKTSPSLHPNICSLFIKLNDLYNWNSLSCVCPKLKSYWWKVLPDDSSWWPNELLFHIRDRHSHLRSSKTFHILYFPQCLVNSSSHYCVKGDSPCLHHPSPKRCDVQIDKDLGYWPYLSVGPSGPWPPLAPLGPWGTFRNDQAFGHCCYHHFLFHYHLWLHHHHWGEILQYFCATCNIPMVTSNTNDNLIFTIINIRGKGVLNQHIDLLSFFGLHQTLLTIGIKKCQRCLKNTNSYLPGKIEAANLHAS